jgi:Fic family protein
MTQSTQSTQSAYSTNPTAQTLFFEHVLRPLSSPTELLTVLDSTFPLLSTLPAMLVQLDELKRCLDSFRPLNPHQLENLQASWDTAYTYESNRIEGNTLTLSETSLVINDGITVAGKTVHEHLEAINHKEAIIFLRDIASGTEPLSERVIKQLHELILKGSKHHDDRGRYRTVPVTITGTVYLPPQPWQVPKLMEDLLVHYEAKKAHLHPVELAADIHAELVGIHPFIDGNGRSSRLVMNLLLLRAGLPIANISGEKASRMDYYQALNRSHIDGQDEPFRRLVAQCVRHSLFQYLMMVSGNTDVSTQGTGQYFFETMLARLKQ